MKKILIIIIALLLIAFAGIYLKRSNNPLQKLAIAKSEVKDITLNQELQNGDIIFQTSLSSQSKAIQLATKSKYSHCGIVFKEGSKYYVFEAVQPVKKTKLENWIARGENGKFVIKRLKNSNIVLTKANLQKMKDVSSRFNGKNYDLTFEWSDNKIYCSELIWKVYKRALDIELCSLQKLSDFDLSNKSVQNKLRERYGNKIPMEEPVVSPVGIFESPLLTTIKSN